jgi:hypothetical protein
MMLSNSVKTACANLFHNDDRMVDSVETYDEFIATIGIPEHFKKYVDFKKFLIDAWSDDEVGIAIETHGKILKMEDIYCKYDDAEEYYIILKNLTERFYIVSFY